MHGKALALVINGLHQRVLLGLLRVLVLQHVLHALVGFGKVLGGTFILVEVTFEVV